MEPTSSALAALFPVAAMVLLSAGPLLAINSVDRVQDSAPLSSEAVSLRTQVLHLLASGDTLLAMDLLEEAPRSASGDVWVDSLLDRLILPSPSAQPVRSPRNGFWIARLDAGLVPVERSHRLSATSTRFDRVQRLDFAGTLSAIRAGVRLHGLQGQSIDVVAIEPLAEWSIHRGMTDVQLMGWSLWTNELGNDAGGEFQVQVHPTSGWWVGPRISGTLESENTAQISTGFERNPGSWTISGVLRAGWVRMIRPTTSVARLLTVDSIPLFVDGILGQTTRSGDSVSFYPYSAFIESEGVSFERIRPDRWCLEIQTRIQWRSGNFAVGPGLDLESRIAMTEERWLPGMRRRWPSGSTFLVSAQEPSSIYGIEDIYATPVPALEQGHYTSTHVRPHISGSWRSPRQVWLHESLLAWNQPFASAGGHPLADERRGIEARWASSFRW